MKSLIPRFSPFWGFFLARQIDRVANSVVMMGFHFLLTLFFLIFNIRLWQFRNRREQ